MIKRIKVWKMVVLSFVTFGIYNTVWFARRRNEMVNNYNVSIPPWWWLVAPSLVSLAIFIILLFIHAMNPSPTGVVILLVPLMVFPFVISGIFLWWLWQFGKAAEEVTQGRVTLAWVMIYTFLLSGCIQYVLQYYFNRLPKSEKATAKQHQPSKRFVKYSIVAIIVLQVFYMGTGATLAVLSIHPPSALPVKQDRNYIDPDELLREYNGCVRQLNADFPGEITKGPQEEAYNKAYDNCEAIRIRQNAAADEYNASIAQ